MRAEPRLYGDVIEHLVEIDESECRVYLDVACRSRYCYYLERLGYGDDDASKRVRCLLAPLLTLENAANLLVSARQDSPQLVARESLKPDVSERVCPALATEHAGGKGEERCGRCAAFGIALVGSAQRRYELKAKVDERSSSGESQATVAEARFASHPGAARA